MNIDSEFRAEDRSVYLWAQIDNLSTNDLHIAADQEVAVISLCHSLAGRAIAQQIL